MEIIFSAESVKATYIPERKRISFKFKGYAKLDVMIEMFTKVHKYMESHETVSFFNDLREQKGTFTNITKWVLENMRDALDLGLKYDAIVTSDDIFTEFAAEDLSKKIKILELKLFKDINEAEEWISNKENNHL